MRAWQPSAEVWVLAHTKLVTKDFTAPSDARLVESNQKLQEDWQRRKPVMSQQCPWQRHLATEPRGQSALRNLEEDLKSKIIHPSTQPLVKQILNHLTSRVPDDIDIWYMSALRAAASGAHGAGTFLIGSSSNPLCGREGDEIVPFEPHRLVLKASRDERQLLLEFQKLQQAEASVGPLRIPRLLSSRLHSEEGLSAFAQEFVLCSRYLEVGQRERHSASLADLLRVGARPLALEDANRGIEDLQIRLGISAQDLASCSLQDLRHAALQSAELLASLASLEDDLPGATSSSTSPYVSWSTSLGSPPELSLGRCRDVRSLLELAPMLERHLLGKEARASPLHACVRQITEECCEQQFGTPLADILQSARQLQQRLQLLISAEGRDSEDKLPPIEVPNSWSHPRLTCRRLLLRDSESLSGFDLCASGWSGLCLGPVYSDLSRLLTDVLFEAVKLPSFIEDLHMIYATRGHAGLAVPPVLLGEHLGITTGAAALILERVGQDPADWTEEALGEIFREATQDDRPFAIADLAQLMSWLRCGRQRFQGSVALRVSEALIAWELPLHSRPTVKHRPVPKPTRNLPRPPDAGAFLGHRSVQWGWQAVRETRDAAVDALPALKGDVDELWPLIWLVPSLHRSLQLLGALHLPWMQKVCLLQHIRLLCDQLSLWLESPCCRGGKALEVTRAKRQESKPGR